MNLNQRMAHYTTSQFLGSSRFAEDVLFYKGEDKSTEQSVSVIWDADALPGTNEVEGDGVVLNKRSGRRIRQSLHIECSTDVDVDETADPPDRFVKGDEVVVVKRIMAKDEGGLQLVLCIRVVGQWDRGKHRMG